MKIIKKIKEFGIWLDEWKREEIYIPLIENEDETKGIYTNNITFSIIFWIITFFITLIIDIFL